MTIDFNDVQNFIYNGSEVSKFYIGSQLVWEKSGGEPEEDYSGEYLTIESIDGGTIVKYTMTNSNSSYAKTIYYSRDKSTWSSTKANSNTTLATLAAGEKLYLKGNNTSYCKVVAGSFGATVYTSRIQITGGACKVYGNTMSLLYSDNFATQTTLPTEGNTFRGFFQSSTAITDVSGICFPALSLPAAAYYQFFSGCTNLTKIMKKLPATTLGNSCYNSMFQNCTSLTTAPELPAMTMVNSCYSNMFNGCSSLTKAPQLPAMTLEGNCYNGMFLNCTSLTTAPQLPATTMAANSYMTMFSGCRSLVNAPAIAATTVNTNSCMQMFLNCTSLEIAPTLYAPTLAINCYNGMFNGCTSLRYIKMLATDVSAANCMLNWVNNVAASGEFVKSSNATWDVSGANGVPEGWTIATE